MDLQGVLIRTAIAILVSVAAFTQVMAADCTGTQCNEACPNGPTAFDVEVVEIVDALYGRVAFSIHLEAQVWMPAPTYTGKAFVYAEGYPLYIDYCQVEGCEGCCQCTINSICTLTVNDSYMTFEARVNSFTSGGYGCFCSGYYTYVPVSLNKPVQLAELGFPPCEAKVGDPIDARSGNVYYEHEDASIDSWTGVPIRFTRSYNSGLPSTYSSAALGPRWTHSLAVRAIDFGTYVAFVTGTGQVLRLDDNHHPLGLGDGYEVVRDASTNRIAITDYATALRYVFNPNGSLDTLADRDYGRLFFLYDQGRLSRVSDIAGRYLTFHYDPSGMLDSVRQMNGQLVAAYEYDAAVGDTLRRATYADGTWEAYHYKEVDTIDALLDVIETSDGTKLQYEYDSHGRAIRTSLNDTLNVDSLWYVMGEVGDEVLYQTHARGSDEAVYESWFVPDNSHRVLSETKNASCGLCGNVYSYDSDYHVSAITHVSGSRDSLAYGDHARLAHHWRDLGGDNELESRYFYLGPYSLLQEAQVASLHDAGLWARAIYTRDSAGNAVWAKSEGAFGPSSYYSDSSGSVFGEHGELLLFDRPREDVADTTAYRYYPNHDLMNVIEANGDVTTFGQLDNLGNPTWERSPNGDTTRYHYDEVGRLRAIVARAGQSDSLTTSFEHNHAGKVTKVTLPKGNSLDYVYDDNGLLTEILNQIGEKIHYGYDDYSRLSLVAMVDSSGDTVAFEEYAYNARGGIDTLRHPGGSLATFEYDPAGNLYAASDPNGNRTVFEFDPLNRLTRTGRFFSPGLAETHYGYDHHDNLTRVLDPDGNEYCYSYSDNGLLMYDSCAATGPTRYAYDPNGNLIALKNAAGDSLHFTYDALDRLTDIACPDSQNVRYQYDGAQYAYGRGRLHTETTPSCSTTFRYDQYGRLWQEFRVTAGDTARRTDYIYDKNDNITAIYYPSGNIYYYDYDAADQVTMITWKKGGHYALDTLVSNIKYDPFGEATQWTLGNGVVVSESRNLRYFVDSITTTPANVLGRTYEYDSVGNVMAATDLRDSLNTARFAYDSLYQLIRAVSPRYPDSLLRYDFSANGNRISLLVDSGTAQQRTILLEYADNRLMRSIDGDTTFFGYDAIGNVTSIRTGGDVTTYEYSSLGQLVSVDSGLTAQYAYDGLGRRVKAIAGSGGQYLFYDKLGRLVSEFRTSNRAWDRDYVYLNGRLLARLEPHYDPGIESLSQSTLDEIIEPPPPPGQVPLIDVFYYHTDYQGTPLAMTNSSQTVVWKARYSPFGELTYEFVSTVNDFRFPGQVHDRQTGLHYNWFRYYDPKTGRYLQPDPIGLSGSINPYAYANGNPGIYIDPDGRFPILLAIWGGYEIFSSLADLWAFLQTLDDPCASLGEKITMAGAVALGAVGPGGGYGTAFRRGAKTVLSKNTFRKNLKLMTGQNPSPFVHAHHVFPVAFESRFAEIGIRNIHLPAYGAWWGAGSHLRKSWRYRQEWKEFLDTPGISAEDAYGFARQLAKRYGYRIHF